MDKDYEIPPGREVDLQVGKWVEILEAYGNPGDREAIRVSTMRIGNERLDFAAASPKGQQVVALRPHEGRITRVDHLDDRTRFRLRLGA